MKLLLAQNATYYPALGGANKSNRTLFEELQKLGHECRAVVTTPKNPTADESLDDVNPVYINDDVAVFDCNNVSVYAVKVNATMDFAVLREYLVEQIVEFNPDFVLVSTEDVGQVLLEAAIKTAAHKVIYLARTTLYLPFGPDCYLNIPSKAKLLAKAAGVISVGEYLSDYIKKWGNVNSVVLPISLFGKPPFNYYGNYSEGYVTMINPCTYKGISIFIELARLLPQIKFAAVPTWGTTTEDIAQLQELPNITIFNPVEKIDEIFCKSRVVIVPSLWAEAKSRTIVEAMARGIPVLASDVGGNSEAKLGVEYVLPVDPISGYNEQCDEKSLPITSVPKQNITVWYDALHRLLTDEKHYYDVSRRSQAAATEYIKNRGGIEKVEEYLLNMLNKRDVNQTAITDLTTEVKTNLTEKLTPLQLALLAKRLKNK